MSDNVADSARGRLGTHRSHINSRATDVQLNVESDEDGDGKHIKYQFSPSCVHRFLKTLAPNQKDFIIKHGLGYVFDIKNFHVPIELTEWVMSKTFATSHEFIFNHKFIHFTKDMVIKVLGFPSGSQPVQSCSDDFEIEALVEKYKLEYEDQNSYIIRKCMDLISKENDETTFMRHFLMFLISTILILGKANTLTVEYLYSLVDVEKFASYDWAKEKLLGWGSIKASFISTSNQLRDILTKTLGRSSSRVSVMYKSRYDRQL
ncbi:hypothetical protein U9M48_024945 [Paspalum notatum var. saurae]|uniref:DUF1985 domain-containing protein n=1 Tax=Paspalum notatum var. saurae TaxID=547442 RepID=A0AAQ3TTZ8_PASNO